MPDFTLIYKPLLNVCSLRLFSELMKYPPDGEGGGGYSGGPEEGRSWGRTLYLLLKILLETTHIRPRTCFKQVGHLGKGEGPEGAARRSRTAP